ncbi:GTP binding domain [Trinorchestia longiramus]|nr:GTP binding domain [Trinorchestia longiramus]
MAAARKVVRHGLEMRAEFDFSKYRLTSLFLRHMHTGLLQVMGKLHGIDAVIEVHDARVPFTGRNFKLSDIGIIKPSLLVMNKVDLIDSRFQDKIVSRFAEVDQKVVFTNAKDSSDECIAKIVPEILNKLKETNRGNRSEMNAVNLMVVGIPNVGKSSLINALRCRNMHRKKSAPVAPRPGVTRCVMERIKVCRRPEVYVRDTPGVLSPSLPSTEAGVKLALAAIVSDNYVNSDIMADYLLFRLNRAGRREYVDVLQLPTPTDNCLKLLSTIALRHGMIRKGSIKLGLQTSPNLTEAAGFFIKLWRNGDLGCQMLDDHF